MEFGIVSEGITDHALLESILLGYFKGWGDKPKVRPLMPADETSANGEPVFGGWHQVFWYLRQREHEEAILQFDNFYLVIHLDTDVSEQKGFDIPWREEGRELSPEELIKRVVDRLIREIGEEFYAKYRDRFVFAIAVHSIECWLLPFLDDSRADKSTGCLNAANRALRKKNTKALSTENEETKYPRAYQEASKEFRNHRNLMILGPKNPSLHVFLEGLKALPLPAAPQS